MDLFEKAISYWPKEIIVNSKKLHENGGATIPKLTEIHNTIENQLLLDQGSSSLMQMDWAIYTVLHKLARSVDMIKPHEVDICEVDAIYSENINME